MVGRAQQQTPAPQTHPQSHCVPAATYNHHPSSAHSASTRHTPPPPTPLRDTHAHGGPSTPPADTRQDARWWSLCSGRLIPPVHSSARSRLLRSPPEPTATPPAAVPKPPGRMRGWTLLIRATSGPLTATNNQRPRQAFILKGPLFHCLPPDAPHRRRGDPSPVHRCHRAPTVCETGPDTGLPQEGTVPSCEDLSAGDRDPEAPTAAASRGCLHSCCSGHEAW